MFTCKGSLDTPPEPHHWEINTEHRLSISSHRISSQPQLNLSSTRHEKVKTKTACCSCYPVGRVQVHVNTDNKTRVKSVKCGVKTLFDCVETLFSPKVRISSQRGCPCTSTLASLRSGFRPALNEISACGAWCVVCGGVCQRCARRGNQPNQARQDQERPDPDHIWHEKDLAGPDRTRNTRLCCTWLWRCL